MNDIYFNADLLGNPVKSYVAFLDVMGMQNHLTSSLKTSANFMFKFHAAILSTIKHVEESCASFTVYPIMDGAYVTTKESSHMMCFLSLLFTSLARLYLAEENTLFRFIPRGAVSYGDLYHGSDVPEDASLIFSENKEYKANLLIGKPMIKAFQYERHAAPFGIYIDDCASCRFCENEKPFYREWRWYKYAPYELNKNDEALDVGKLSKELLKVFNELANRSYSEDEVRRHKAHQRSVERYFSESD